MSQMLFIEIDYNQKSKEHQLVAGDIFLSRKLKEERRIVSVLSDGLGSGVKANVLATLTATMALNYVSQNFDIQKAAQVIMATLPVCKIRKISYSTFTIIDIDKNGLTRIVEYDNPSFVLVRDGEIIPVKKETIEINSLQNHRNYLHFTQFQSQLGDRIIMFSDGVTQSGIGTDDYPLGWGEEEAGAYIRSVILQDPNISARNLAQKIVDKAYWNDRNRAMDDITCGVLYFREPRRLMVLSGPPIDKSKDPEIASILQSFSGRKIICGGTTATIVARELKKQIHIDMHDINREVPPVSAMEGVDLITEGTITLAKVVEILEKDLNPDTLPQNGATRLVNYLFDSDIIHFVIGTKINDAHQDPNVPVELEIRRNIIKNIVRLMENKYLKETVLQFI